MYRRQLANIDSDAEQGRIAAEEAAEARAEITRRMLAAADQEKRSTAAAGGQPEGNIAADRRRPRHCRRAAGIGPRHLLRGRRTGGDRPDAERPPPPDSAPHDRAELSAAADQLKARLQREPGHKEGWVLLGRTFASLGRLAEAREAYGRAIALAPNEPELHAEIGELLVLAARRRGYARGRGRVCQIRR